MKLKISKSDLNEKSGFWTVSTPSLKMYEFCKKHRIKIEEPQDEDGLYNNFIIHLPTLEKQVLFENQYTGLLKKLSSLTGKH